MINQKAIEKFLSRVLDNYDWMKDETVEEINAYLAAMDPQAKLDKLWVHQRVCFILCEHLRRFMLHIDMGGGKTLITLSLLSYRKLAGHLPKAIVFVPYITAVETWVEETHKHAPTLVCVPLVGTTADNLAKLVDPALKGDLYVISYPSAVAMLAEPARGKNLDKSRPATGKMSLRLESIRAIFSSFDTLVMDEIHKCKSVTSLTYRMCRTISAKCEYVLGLTGTPFGRDLTDLWPQFYLIDFGETLGPTLGFYRAAFFNQKINYWGGYEYKFQKKLFSRLQALIKNISIRYSLDDFYDMPPKEYISRLVTPHAGISGYADRSMGAIREILKTKNNTYRAIESEYLKLRQLSSGFMTLKGEDNNKLQIKFDENPKLDVLQELVESMPYGCKMVVFHHFVYTNELISERLKSMKIKHARIYGKSKDPIAELRRFKADPDCTVLVLNSKSGSSSLNLQMANYAVFFEQPDSAIDRQQAEHRIWRPGQSKRALFYDLVMANTVDAQMLKWNKDGENLLTALLDGRAKL